MGRLAWLVVWVVCYFAVAILAWGILILIADTLEWLTRRRG